MHVHEYIREMDGDEAKQRLLTIAERCQAELNSGRPMLTRDYDVLYSLWRVAWGDDDGDNVKGKEAVYYEGPISMARPESLEHVIISCDASITENPNGKVAVGVVIEFKNEKPIELFRKVKKSNTCNQGEYDAVYYGLTQLMALKNNPGCEIEVRSDSQLVVNQLNGKWKCNDPELKRRRDSVLELVESLPVPVSFQWRPRNSTPALEQANYLAQDALGVSRH